MVLASSGREPQAYRALDATEYLLLRARRAGSVRNSSTSDRSPCARIGSLAHGSDSMGIVPLDNSVS